MESTENGFKRHNLIPFSQKIPRAVAASLTSREEKTVWHHPLFKRKKKSVSLSNSCTFHISKFFRKRKWTRNRLKCLRMHHLHPFFEKFLGEVPGPIPYPSCKGIFPITPKSPYRSEVGLKVPPAVDLVSGSIIDYARYILMQFY